MAVETVVIGTIVFFLLLCLFALLFVPVLDIGVPASLRKNAFIRKFFAWDCLETHETKFNQEALKQYLEHRNRKE